MTNRIRSSSPGQRTARSTEPARPAATLLTTEVSADGIALFTPLHYEPNYAYPLIVWLHGDGESESSLRRSIAHISLRNYAAVAPRGSRRPVRSVMLDSDDQRLGWWQTSSGVEAARSRVFAAIDRAVSQLNIHENRLFLAGTGPGGTMALRVALSDPARFAGVLSIDGGMPRGGAPLRRVVEARRLPLFLASGRASSAYAPQDVCHDLRLMHAAGMSVTLKEYPGRNPFRPQVLSDINRWIMEIIASQREATVVTSA